MQKPTQNLAKVIEQQKKSARYMSRFLTYLDKRQRLLQQRNTESLPESGESEITIKLEKVSEQFIKTFGVSSHTSASNRASALGHAKHSRFTEGIPNRFNRSYLYANVDFPSVHTPL